MAAVGERAVVMVCCAEATQALARARNRTCVEPSEPSTALSRGTRLFWARFRGRVDVSTCSVGNMSFGRVALVHPPRIAEFLANVR
eukprot:scaffold11747_cov90-Isochrysis_galbana.AAC.4